MLKFDDGLRYYNLGIPFHKHHIYFCGEWWQKTASWWYDSIPDGISLIPLIYTARPLYIFSAKTWVNLEIQNYEKLNLKNY